MRGNERGGDFSSRVPPRSLLPITAIGVGECGVLGGGAGCSRERPNAASSQRSRGSLRCAFCWDRRRRALPRTRPSRSLPGQTRSGQTLRSPQHGSAILALVVVGDAVHGTRVAAETPAAWTVLQPLRAGPIIRADRFGGLLPDAGSARRIAETNG